MMFRDDCRDVPKPCQTSEVVKPSLSLSTPVYCAVSLITNQTSSLVSLYELKAVETSLASKIISSVSPQVRHNKTREMRAKPFYDTSDVCPPGFRHHEIVSRLEPHQDKDFSLLLFILLNEDVEVSGHVWELWVIWDWSGYDCGQFLVIRSEKREHVEVEDWSQYLIYLSPTTVQCPPPLSQL